MNELIVFVPKGIDALGTLLNIDVALKEVPKKIFYTNYGDLSKQVDEILEYTKTNGNTHIIIADIAFSDNKELLMKLYNNLKCIIIDHHVYPDGFWDDMGNAKIVWASDKSTSKLCQEHFQTKHKSDRIATLTMLIDAYDLWKTERPEFSVGQELQYYFSTRDIDELYQEIIELGYKLPETWRDEVKEIIKQRDMDVGSYYENGTIQRGGEMTFVFAQDWFEHVLVEEMKRGQQYVIGISPYGIVKVRFNKDSPMTLEQKNKIRKELTGSYTKGQPNAFTYRYDAPKTLDNAMIEAQKIAQLFGEVLK